MPTLREAAPRLHHLIRAKLETGGGGRRWGRRGSLSTRYAQAHARRALDFGKAELVQGNDNGAEGLLRADDENFDGFAIGLGDSCGV